jgi:hypothetical protein
VRSSLDPGASGTAASDLPDAAALLDHDGPFASVLLPTDRTEADSAKRLAVRWDEASHELATRGAPADLLDEMGAAVLAGRTEDDAVCCVAAVDGPAVLATGPWPGRDLVRWDSLPAVLPVVAWHQASPPALLVVADRTGADIFGAGPDTGLLDVVEPGDPTEVRRSAPGGWSQRRYQQRAQERWRANAQEAAAKVADEARRIGARLIVIAGDDHAVELVAGDLPDEQQSLVRRVAGGRGPGSDGDLEAGSARWYRTAVAEDDVAIIERFKQELGRQDRAVAGVAATCEALQRAAVDTLLLHDDPDEHRRMFFRTSDRTSVALHEAELEGTDLADGALGDVLLRAAWGSGARVRLVPRFPELTDGVGAVLRFA